MVIVQTRIMRTNADGATTLLDVLPAETPEAGWVWVDILAEPGDEAALAAMAAQLDLDALAVRDAVQDVDLSKVDDFGHHLLVILHGLRDDAVDTYEVHCFMTAHHLVTLHHDRSPAIDALWRHLQSNPQLAAGGVDVLVARLADVLMRRLLSVVEAFDERIDSLIDEALAADPDFLGEMVAVRIHLGAVRRVVNPQRETLDVLRQSTSPLMSDAGRRRLSDVFDVAVRAAGELEAARTALSETLEAYRGAEAREATDVTKVLTIYAAIMLPLALIAGFFGMNFPNLPWLESERGWVIVAGFMVGLAVLSLGVFVALGWIRRPSGREAGAALGRGLIEAARAPVHVGGALYEVSTMPLRSIASRRRSASSSNMDRE